MSGSISQENSVPSAVLDAAREYAIDVSNRCFRYPELTHTDCPSSVECVAADMPRWTKSYDMAVDAFITSEMY